MMAIDFIILLFALLSAWSGVRRLSILLFFASFFFSIGLFYHHMTNTIGLAL